MIRIYTDGSCWPNPGPGGYAAIVVTEHDEWVISGNDPHTTNQRMELLSAIYALESLDSKCQDVLVITDSQYLIGFIERRYHAKKNADLVARLDKMLDLHNVTAKWVKGHNGNEMNEKADALAEAERAKLSDIPNPF